MLLVTCKYVTHVFVNQIISKVCLKYEVAMCKTEGVPCFVVSPSVHLYLHIGNISSFICEKRCTWPYACIFCPSDLLSERGSKTRQF